MIIFRKLSLRNPRCVGYILVQLIIDFYDNRFDFKTEKIIIYCVFGGFI